MSPLDDGLRAALHGRAATVDPSPDPLSGIEGRASRIRRNKIAASVAGSALAVAAIAAVVPALPSSGPAPRTDVRVAVSATPTPAPQASSYALDPQDPWEYRGDASLVTDREVDTFTREWATTRGLSADRVTWAPLFGQVREPSGLAEVVYVATDDEGNASWGVATGTEAGPECVFELPVEPGTTALVAPLPGDEADRVLVTATPAAGAVRYSPDGSTWTAAAALEPGVATVAREGDP